MFKFNFALDDSNVIVTTKNDSTSVTADNVTNNMATLSIQPESTITAVEKADISVLLSTLPEAILTQVVLPVTDIEAMDDKSCLLPLKRRELSDIKFQIAQEDEIKEESQGWLHTDQSDLINGVYEGGFKTWECAFDLIKLLDELYSIGELNGQRVLEVTLPSIRLLQRHPEIRMDMQDYNMDVTQPYKNDDMNEEEEGEEEEEEQEEESDDERPLVDYSSPDCHLLPVSDAERMALAQTVGQRSDLYAGDWSYLSTTMAELNSYDLILSAETLYHADNHERLYTAIRDTMRKPDGKA
ncbi:hypothetical protein BDF22DRAFT_668444 [Syncephalis plumigaleata]|nr:hypothetical protein BDF22DRAFT_668444 [Syncephalis plumigaleata]